MIKIALDAGHGGNNSTPGKRTPDNEYEWDFNCKVANYCAEKLKSYGKFEVLRVDDITGKTDTSLQKRTSKANQWGANLYISIHQNANTAKWGTWGGTETFYHSESEKAMKLAKLVQSQLVKNLKLRDRGIKKGNHLHVIRATNMPSILTEGAFMDSLTDINSLRNESELKKQGYAIAKGIAEYFDIKEKEPIVKEEKGGVKLLKDATATSLRNEFIADLEKAYTNKVFTDKKWIEQAKNGTMTLADAFLLSNKMNKSK